MSVSQIVDCEDFDIKYLPLFDYEKPANGFIMPYPVLDGEKERIFSLVEKAVNACKARKVNFKVGNILSSDTFYDDANSGMEWAKMGVLGVEMESAALYCNASRLGKKALCICTVSDSFIYPEENTTAEERQNSFTTMMEIALEIAE